MAEVLFVIAAGAETTVTAPGATVSIVTTMLADAWLPAWSVTVMAIVCTPSESALGIVTDPLPPAGMTPVRTVCPSTVITYSSPASPI